MVVFDVRANHDTGISRYGLSLLGAAAPLAVEAGWRVLVVTRPAQEVRAQRATAGLDLPILNCPDDNGFVRRSPWLRDLLESHAADLYYTSHYTVDRDCPAPFVFTIHDLTRLRFPELSYTDMSFAQRFGAAELNLVRDELADLSDWDEPQQDEEIFTRYFRALNRNLVSRAQRVSAVSSATAKDIQTLLGVDPSRLDLVPCGVDTTVFHRRDEDCVRAVRNTYGLAGQYLVFVGLTHPNKRFAWLVDQLARQRNRFPTAARLVAVGGYAEQVPEVGKALAEHDAEDFITFTGRISDADLSALYSGAAALVTASLNEGNNLPPLEAMACGSQVIATDIPPLRETLGTSAIFYDPTNGDQLVELAETALSGRLPNRAAMFKPPTWADAGTRIVETFARATGTAPSDADAGQLGRARAFKRATKLGGFEQSPRQ